MNVNKIAQEATTNPKYKCTYDRTLIKEHSAENTNQRTLIKEHSADVGLGVMTSLTEGVAGLDDVT